MERNRAQSQGCCESRVCDLSCWRLRAAAPRIVIYTLIVSMLHALTFVTKAVQPDGETSSISERRLEAIVRAEWEPAGQVDGVASSPVASSSNSSSAQKPGMAELNPDASDTVPAYMRHMTAVLVTLHVSVFISGLVGNSLVCLSVYRNKSLQTITNYYIVNLAVADFLVILICLPPTVYWDLTLTWSFGPVLCKMVLYLQSISVSVSVLTLTCISMDRWYAICHPLKFCSTKSRAKITIGLIWVASLLIASPDVIFLTTRPLYEEEDYVYMDCTYSWSEQSTRFYQLCIVALLFVLPFVLMTISYAQIVNVLWRNETMAESVQNAMSSEAAARLRDQLAHHKEQSIESRIVYEAPKGCSNGFGRKDKKHININVNLAAGERQSAGARRLFASSTDDFDEAFELTDERRKSKKYSSAVLSGADSLAAIGEQDSVHDKQASKTAGSTLARLAAVWLAPCRHVTSRECLAPASQWLVRSKTARGFVGSRGMRQGWPRLSAISARYFSAGQLLKNGCLKRASFMTATRAGVKLEVSNYHEHEAPLANSMAPSRTIPPEGQLDKASAAHGADSSLATGSDSDATRWNSSDVRQVSEPPIGKDNAKRSLCSKQPNSAGGSQPHDEVVDDNVDTERLAAGSANHAKHGARRPLNEPISFIMTGQARQLSAGRRLESLADDDGRSTAPPHDKLVASAGLLTVTTSNNTAHHVFVAHPRRRSRSIARACVALGPAASKLANQRASFNAPESSQESSGLEGVPAIKRRSSAAGELAVASWRNEDASQLACQRHHNRHRSRHNGAHHNHRAHHRFHFHHQAKCINRPKIKHDERATHEVGSRPADQASDYYRGCAGIALRRRCCCQQLGKRAPSDVACAESISSRGVLMAGPEKQRIKSGASERIEGVPPTSERARAQTNGRAQGPIKLASAGGGGDRATSQRLVGCEAHVCCSKCFLQNSNNNRRFHLLRQSVEPEPDRQLRSQSAGSIAFASAARNKAPKREVKGQLNPLNGHSQDANAFALPANNLVQCEVRNGPTLICAINHYGSPQANDSNKKTSSHTWATQRALAALSNGCASLPIDQSKEASDRQLGLARSSPSHNSSQNSLLINTGQASVLDKLPGEHNENEAPTAKEPNESVSNRISPKPNGSAQTCRAASNPIERQATCASYLSTGSSHIKTGFCRLVESRKKAAKMLIVIVIMFGLCYLPVHLINTLRVTIGLPQNDITTIASLVSHWLCYFNSAVNPLIYNLMSGKFRHEFANLFFCRWLRRQQPHHSRQSRLSQGFGAN